MFKSSYGSYYAYYYLGKIRFNGKQLKNWENCLKRSQGLKIASIVFPLLLPTLVEGYLQSPSNLSLTDVATLLSHEVNLVIQENRTTHLFVKIQGNLI